MNLHVLGGYLLEVDSVQQWPF